jgi:hypothetical protein
MLEVQRHSSNSAVCGFSPTQLSILQVGNTRRAGNAAPALSPDALGRLDAILLSHDHHFDNLDHVGRALLGNVDRVLTTQDGALRLGRNVIGLAAGKVWICRLQTALCG